MLDLIRFYKIRHEKILFINTIVRTTKRQFLLKSAFVIRCIDNKLPLFKPRCEKTGFCICENKDADQLRGYREADQRLCFRYIDSIIPLLPKYKISSL